MRKVSDFLVTLWGLRTFGQSLLTKSVVSAMRFRAWLLTLVLCSELFGYGVTFGFGLETILGSIAMTVVFAGIVVIYDRFASVVGTKSGGGPSEGFRFFKWRIPIGKTVLLYSFRMVSALILTAIVAVPLSLAFFKKEIDERMNVTEQHAVDGIRSAAITAENNRYAESQHATGNTVGNDVDSVRANRAGGRLELLRQQGVERDRRSNLAAQLHREAVAEGGGARSGIQGLGPRYQAILAQAEAADQAVTEYNQTAEQERNRFDAETDRLVSASQGTRNSAVSTELAEHNRRIEDLRNMQPAELARRYGGTYLEARGFLRRYEVLEQILQERPKAHFIVNGLHLLMFMMSLLVILSKPMSGMETQRYYNVGAQAAEGNEEALTIIKGMGYGNAKAYAMESEVRDALTDFYKNCRNVTEKIQAMYLARIDFAQELRDGKHLTLAQIEGKLLGFWLKDVMPALNKLREQADKLRLDGIGGIDNIDAPNWPGDLNNGEDPRRVGYSPWHVTREELVMHGWIDPEPLKKELEEKITECRQVRNDILKRVGEMERMTVSMARDDAPTTSIQNHRWSTWNELIELLTTLDAIEARIKELKGTLPEWPRYAQDPRLGLQDKVQDLSESQIAQYRPAKQKTTTVN